MSAVVVDLPFVPVTAMMGALQSRYASSISPITGTFASWRRRTTGEVGGTPDARRIDEAFARDIHFARPKSIAYAILDSRLFDIPGYQRAIRSEVPPTQAGTLAEVGGADFAYVVECDGQKR